MSNELDKLVLNAVENLRYRCNNVDNDIGALMLRNRNYNEEIDRLKTSCDRLWERVRKLEAKNPAEVN